MAATKKSTGPKKRWFKILKDGRSCHGGDFKWSLPKGDRPGKWHRIDGELLLCERGFHVTDRIDDWLVVGGTIYAAEVENVGAYDSTAHKAVVGGVRLIAEVAAPAWWRKVETFVESLAGMPWLDNHTDPKPEWRVFETMASAMDSAMASARDSAWASAWASAMASARDSAWASARESAMDSAMASARASAMASARDSARDSAMYVSALVTNFKFDAKHAAHIKARWDVWQRGYGLLCDVDGILYVYRKP